MALAAPAQYQTNNPNEMNNPHIPQEDMEKLQEIHELINVLFTELTSRAPQSVAMPYAHSQFHYAWAMAPYLRTPGF